MHENVFRIHKKHIKKFLGRIKNDIYREMIPFQAEYGVTEDPVNFKDRLKLKYEKIKEGELWGKTWDSAWFHLERRRNCTLSQPVWGVNALRRQRRSGLRIFRRFGLLRLVRKRKIRLSAMCEGWRKT